MTSFMRGTGGIAFSDLLKDGAKHFSGVDEATMRNIEAVKKLSQITRTSLGPNGMNKLIKNHLEKIFVTNDAATILKEMEVVHPAAKLVGLAASMQENEAGDATNLVVVFAGELLAHAESLITKGLHSADIIGGYIIAGHEALRVLDELAVKTVSNVRDTTDVTNALKPVIASHQYGLEDFMSGLVAKACIDVCPSNPKFFNTDNVRVTKIIGSTVTESTVVNGFVLARDSEGVIKHATGCKVAVFTCGIEASSTETKGTVLLKTAEELEQYSLSEEHAVEKMIKEVSDAGVSVVVCNGSISEMALHFLERFNIMVVKCPSKFELRRVMKTCNAVGMARVGTPTEEELGRCDSVSVDEIGGTKCVIFRQDAEDTKVATIVLRSSTQNTLDDLDRSLQDAINVYKGICKDGRLVAGAGGAEIEIASRLQQLADSTPGLEQYAIRKFSEGLEVVPRTLAENAGQDATQAISNLYAAHASGTTAAGIDVEEGGTLDTVAANILDHLPTKLDAIRLATDAAVTVLRVDQIIMAKQAGGPKPPSQGGMDMD
eukprot:CAMPEP_0175848062 /NCGR_PEP_ID=MMETSP0107_2-20121207/23709_1 /TAXON_ID=195067 ORGANISM="Goniomonas pacifica, Strain CCMP1869" /NCGR_SAMPLE_ID=MMETSP0107_2 /ASSEMBLY_ACC=CAM_ASM_000203 /LENGTH=545 /DNA_ID=CAMNT_0017162965 /DNA_START=19 /DNA_END=1656 /DNA_ORIENTATION=-